MGLRFPPSGFTDRSAARAGVRYASLLRRLGGGLVDAVIVYTISWLLLTLYSLTIGGITNRYWAYDGLVVVSGTMLLYSTLCLANLNGQTPGMRVVAVRCTPMGSRRRITLPQALTRQLVGTAVTTSAPLAMLLPQLAGLPDLGILLGVLLLWCWPLVDQRRQLWWDHLAATVVLDEHEY